MTKASPEISLKGVWKLFGKREPDALAAIREEGIGKDEVARRFGCVVGVADVTIEVMPGEILCIMGLSGSGKSTLIRHINRLLEPTAGEIWVGGENVLAKKPAELRALRAHQIGMVFQAFGLLPHRTVRDNVALPLEIQSASRQRRFDVAEAALARVNLAGWGDRYCNELSGGMQQRVGLARALAANPPILLMDEPFSALDPLVRRQLQDEFIGLSRGSGKTVVFITHDLDEAIRIGNRIAIMKDGAILQTGKPQDIVARPANAYVAEFVANVSPLDVLTAADIMESAEHLFARNGSTAGADLRQVSVETRLGELVALSAASSEPVAVIDREASIVGYLDRALVLGAVDRKRLS